MLSWFKSILVLAVFAVPFAGNASLKVGYGAGITDENAFKKMSDAGLNYYIWKMGISPVTGGKIKWEKDHLSVIPNENVIAKIKKAAKMADKYGIKLLLSTSFNKYTLKALKKLGKYDRAIVEGPRSYLSRGINNAPWPGDRKLWNGIMLEDAVIAAKLAKENPGIGGFLFDLEMYAGKINWWYCASFDARSMEYFGKKNPNVKVPVLKIGERYEWLRKNKLLGKYYSCLSELPYSKSKSIAKAVKQINPDFQLGMYAFGRDWFHPWFAKGLAETMDNPVWIFSEDEYNTGFSPAVFATMRYIDKMNFKYRYVPGLHIVKHPPKALEKQIKYLVKACDGYWLYTMATLLVPQNKLPKGYKTPAGSTPENYWQALKAANNSQIENIALAVPASPNIFQRKSDSKTMLPKCVYSPAPENICGKPVLENALFDGLDILPGIVAWNLGKGPFRKKVQAIITLPEEVTVNKIGLAVPTTLVRNFRVVKNFDVVISVLRKGRWHTAGKWKAAQIKKKNQFFNIIKSFSKPVTTNKIVVTLKTTSDDKDIKAIYHKYDAVYLVLSEVCIWGENK
jgi:hypothetical protein